MSMENAHEPRAENPGKNPLAPVFWFWYILRRKFIRSCPVRRKDLETGQTAKVFPKAKLASGRD
jgi:hypothetical protein